MNLANLTFQSIRILLLPVSVLYGLVVWVRNLLFDRKVFSSTAFNLPVICIGNLSVGGTGKSPMTEYIIRLLQHQYRLATVSRGYKRKTKGYVLASQSSTALEIGDEPMQFHLKFPEVAVAVGESRVEAIPQLLQDVPETQVILLDDGFQHRWINPGFSIVLTDAGNLFTRDYFLPTGDLRDEKRSYKRADVIMVTKCKADLTADQQQSIIAEINPLPHQRVYFSTIEYGKPYHILQQQESMQLHRDLEVLLVTGIANMQPLKKYLQEQTYSYEHLSYGDHHLFTIDDLREMKRRFERMNSRLKMILTTEKDAVRLVKFGEELAQLPLYVLPIRHRILFDEEQAFKQQLEAFIHSFQPH